MAPRAAPRVRNDGGIARTRSDDRMARHASKRAARRRATRRKRKASRHNVALNA